MSAPHHIWPLHPHASRTFRTRPSAPSAARIAAARRSRRKGTRRKKIEIVQLWRCSSCKRVFTPAPGALRNKTYPLRIVLDAITLHHLGYPLTETAEKMKAKHGYCIGRSTIATWLDEHRALTTYARLRPEGRRLFPPTQTIRSIKLYHRQVDNFAYHRPKLALLRRSREHARFAGLADFLERVPTDCPHELFHESERASQTPLSAISTSRLIVTQKENFATRMAALVVPAIGDNRLRHEALQRFMLANDSVTLAVEVPIWISPTMLEELEREHSIALLPEGRRGSLTGHIDFLQVRNGAVHILDYKPDARTNHPVAQLTVYALALSKLAGIRLFDIKCAWFNKEEYCEFFPRTLLARGAGKAKGGQSELTT